MTPPVPAPRPFWKRLVFDGESLLRIAGIAALLVLALLIGVRAYQSTKGPPLKAWHTIAAEEPDAHDIRAGGWQGYLASEARILAKVRRQLDAEMTRHDRTPLNRYVPGSMSSPDRYPRDWNRSQLLLPTGPPRGVVVLVHGLTDAPYSMHGIAQTYLDHGFVAIVPRMPGHGTVPGALVRTGRRQWGAAVDMAMAEATRRAAGTLPVHLVGYSNGAALVLLHELRRLQDGQPADASQLVLLSPMVQVSAFARYAGLAGLPALLPRFAKSAWSDVLPEYNPFKYNSFPVHAARESYLVTAELQKALGATIGSGRIALLPPVLAFQSVADDTVDAQAVVTRLFDRLAAAGNQLVLFDVNRNRLLDPLRVPGATEWGQALLQGGPLRFQVTVVGTRAIDDAEVVARTRAARTNQVQEQPLALRYPPEVFSLSHVAMPFAANDPLYGNVSARKGALQLGAIAIRGERNALLVSQESLSRLSFNPFHGYLVKRIEAGLPATEAIPVQASAGSQLQVGEPASPRQ